ncbi:hypothetical protein EUGRSUZ_G03112 [Eucalyptus grandis]|uniref:Uncharacterized protein n=2 Tax=Eucalyptus grandis TaxID=71139 RepID=A0ACC3K8P2_EUCGR|nr:hypothetical protein EUGRSUZ_G03112 [Eucalyptus grandis]
MANKIRGGVAAVLFSGIVRRRAVGESEPRAAGSGRRGVLKGPLPGTDSGQDDEDDDSDVVPKGEGYKGEGGEMTAR